MALQGVKAVFLDRDGVINENRPDHVKDWSEFRFLPGSTEAIALLSRAGILVFVISNQAVVNRGIVSRETVDAINSRMIKEIGLMGGRVDAVAYCPHLPEERCNCRKPEPGLLLGIAHQYGLELKNAVVIGDAMSDIVAAQSVGCQAILVMTGRGRDQLMMAKTAGKNSFAVASDLRAAVDLLLTGTVKRSRA